MTERPRELPAANGSTAGRFDPRVPDLSGENLTLEQVAEIYGLSDRTLRRHLAAGQLAGAVQRGRRWMIPRASASARYGAPREEAQESPSTAPTAEVAALLAIVTDLLERDSKAQAQITAGHDQILDERVARAKVEAEKQAEAKRATELERQLDESRAKAEAEAKALQRQLEEARAQIIELSTRRWRIRRRPAK